MLLQHAAAAQIAGLDPAQRCDLPQRCNARRNNTCPSPPLQRCLDPILTIAAAQGWGRPVFWSPPDKREEVGARAAATAVRCCEGWQWLCP